MTARPTMIFHVPFRLGEKSSSASGIRPLKMRQAFRDAGFDVLEISGRHPERKARIAELKRRIRDGLQVSFVYSETSTNPTGLGEPVTRATSLTRDIAFLGFCRSRGIPVGLFYRDVYWQFPIFDELMSKPRAAIMRALYRRDLRGYRRAGVDVYLPSREMARWVPIVDPARFRELPPGSDLTRAPDLVAAGGDPDPGPREIRLLYVGGLGNNYRLHESVREIAGRVGVHLTLCTREGEWAARRDEYAPLLADNISVVHVSGDALAEEYREADAALLAVEPIAYWEFAVPMKLMESIGAGVPVIASDGTFTGRFTGEQRAGWTIRYGSGELATLLDRLRTAPGLLAEARERVGAIRHEHTWLARAQQVARDLAGLDPKESR